MGVSLRSDVFKRVTFSEFFLSSSPSLRLSICFSCPFFFGKVGTKEAERGRKRKAWISIFSAMTYFSSAT